MEEANHHRLSVEQSAHFMELSTKAIGIGISKIIIIVLDLAKLINYIYFLCYTTFLDRIINVKAL